MSSFTRRTTGDLVFTSDLSGPDNTIGNILVGNGSVYAAESIGTDGQVLTADSGQTNGIIWSTISAGQSDIIEIYDSTGGQIFDNASTIVIDMDTERTNTNPSVFSAASGVITVNASFTGLVSYRVNTNNTTNTRAFSQGFLQIDTGGGFVTVPGSLVYAYNRNSADGTNSASATFAIDITSGDQLQVMLEGNGGEDLTTVVGSNLVIQRLSSITQVPEAVSITYNTTNIGANAGSAPTTETQSLSNSEFRIIGGTAAGALANITTISSSTKFSVTNPGSIQFDNSTNSQSYYIHVVCTIGLQNSARKVCVVAGTTASPDTAASVTPIAASYSQDVDGTVTVNFVDTVLSTTTNRFYGVYISSTTGIEIINLNAYHFGAMAISL